MHKIDADRIVYHYTDQKGLIGILDTNSIWASHLFYQNDIKEFVHGKELFYDYINNCFPNLFKNCPIDIITEIEKWINVFNTPIFTVSFSEECSSLNQFRSYSKSRSGFSIGFNIDRIIKGLDSKFLYKFIKCIYRKDEQVLIIKKTIHDCIEEKKIKNEINDDFISFVAARIISFSPFVKHPSFSEEKEWRLIFDYLNPIREYYNIRTGDSFLIPYVKIPINPIDVISDIIIGPTPYSELAVTSTKELAYKYGLFSEKLDQCIHYSELPYRNW